MWKQKVLLDSKLCESRVLWDCKNRETKLSLKAQKGQLILVSASCRLADVRTEAGSKSQLAQVGTNIVTLLNTNPPNISAFLVWARNDYFLYITKDSLERLTSSFSLAISLVI